VLKLTLSFRDRILKVHPIADGETLIGRGPECGIQIDNLGVSPIHARITSDHGRAVLTDVSTNGGVKINGETVTEHELRAGDVIAIGKHVLRCTWEERPSAVQPEPITPAMPARGGWLQFLSGPKLGRTIRLDRNLIRLGKSGHNSAMIASRPDGYYISHLEGDPPTRIGDTPIGEDSRKLNDGDTIQIGDTRMLFFLDEATPKAAP
jgi:predicted component of type VI protein secretion system